MIHVIKANAQRELFDERKVIDSIRRARIPQAIQSDVLGHVQKKLYDGISTGEIYRHILEFLDTSAPPYTRSRYSLKQSIMQLGPTGYPFEDFVAEILKAIGYETQVRQILSGKCVSHEIDIVATKNGKRIMIEAKFHNNPGIRSEIHVALYTQARFRDIRERNTIDQAWLVTNTKATIDANTYASCSGMKVISWSSPDGESLRDIIEQTRLHPVTMLVSLSESNKVRLLENHVVLCKQIYHNPSLLDILPLTREEKEKTRTEVTYIYGEESSK